MIRFLDIFLSGLALFALCPLLLVICPILKFSGEGEIFFGQKRIGKNGEDFNLLKFATMLKDSPNLTTRTVTVKNDPRILPVGRFLRKTKINELPQLFNVFRGDMSLIGHRPLTKQTFSYYSDETQRKLIAVKPGLSGIGSIVFRNEENILSEHANPITTYREKIAPYKGDLESWFIDNASLRLYIKCIIATFIVVATSNGKFIWWLFPKLPAPPASLQAGLKYRC